MWTEYKNNKHAWTKLWKHHGGQPEANEINRLAEETGQGFFKRIGKISSELMLPKILELLNDDPEFTDNIKIGVLIEVPSAALIADKLAKHVDFFSIGSNDLTQYTLACDRNNDKVNYLYNPINVAILRLIKYVVDVANENNLPVTICGEMAGRPYYTPIILGLGIKSLSMSSITIPLIKNAVRKLNILECSQLVDDIINRKDEVEGKKLLTSFVKEKLPFTKKGYDI